MGFGLVVGFTENVQLVTINNYSANAISQGLVYTVHTIS
jgi:hypothetical protein